MFPVPRKKQRNLRVQYVSVLALSAFVCTAIGESSSEADRIHTRIQSIPLGEITINVEISEHGSPGITFFNMHDNENTAVEASKMVLAKNEGRFIQLLAQGNRLIEFPLKGRTYTFDPNRIFTPMGIEKTLKKYGAFSPEAQAEIATFASKLIDLVAPGSRIIIAVHNNTPGQYSINSYASGGSDAKEAAEVYINHNQDPDDFYYVTEKALFSAIKNGGHNVILQNEATVTDDGSLSVYCGRKGIRYVNVETEHGHLDPQVKMLKFILSVL
jgi:hypothetical protein